MSDFLVGDRDLRDAAPAVAASRPVELCAAPIPRHHAAKTMTPEQAAWVREFAWPARWRRSFAEMPTPFLRCACQQGKSYDCSATAHRRCPGESRPQNETVISAAFEPYRHAYLPQPYEHPTIVGTSRLALVWLVARRCRHRCTCRCHTDPEFLHPLRGPQTAIPMPSPVPE